MSLQAIRWAMEQRAGNATAKAVLLVLAEGANATGQAFPSQQHIAEVLEVTDRSVRNALATLEAAGLIEAEARWRKGGSRTSNRYRLCTPEGGSGMVSGKSHQGNNLTIPEGDSGGKEETGSGMVEIGGGIPERDSGLVPTVLEPTDIPPLPPVNGEATKPRGRAKVPKHPLPDDWEPTEAHHRIAKERDLPIGEEAAKMRDWATANAEKKADWDATFRNWLRNARRNGKGYEGPKTEDYVLTPDDVEW